MFKHHIDTNRLSEENEEFIVCIPQFRPFKMEFVFVLGRNRIPILKFVFVSFSYSFSPNSAIRPNVSFSSSSYFGEHEDFKSSAPKSHQKRPASTAPLCALLEACLVNDKNWKSRDLWGYRMSILSRRALRKPE